LDWRSKALLQAAFSGIPGGEALNFFLQRYVTRSLPISEPKFVEMVQIAGQHVEGFRRHSRRPLEAATFYEFGAGWDLVIPLSFYAFGVSKQILVDVRRLFRASLVADTIRKFDQNEFDGLLWRQPGPAKAPQRLTIETLESVYGIRYRAPSDASDTGLPSSSVDSITSTDVLEHIREGSILPILRECYRLLRDDGVMSLRVDYQDHYAYFDSQITIYNFLRYSDTHWRLFNSALHHQNRLRHPDYLNLLATAGFEVLESHPFQASEHELEMLRNTPIADRFRSYEPADLAIRGSHLVLRKLPADVSGFPRRDS
jgi:SAM-dependent methyltransferase